jgi:hypothetical protein
MLFAMVASVFLPLFSRQALLAGTPLPTDAPSPTAPPAVDINTISFDQVYLHPSGLFTVAEPSGWSQVQTSSNSASAQVNFSNNTALSVVEAYIQVPSTLPKTTQELQDFFKQSDLEASWSNYTTRSEAARRLDGDKVIIDFNLTLGTQPLIARHEAWTDGQWIYVVRVVTPANAPDMLKAMLDKEIPTLKPNKQFAGTPIDWNAYFDPKDRHIIRYPKAWTLADSAPGLPASITSDNLTLRVSAQDGAVKDDAAAQAWVQSAQAGATILSATAVQRQEGSGFAVAYTFKNADGDSQSGLAVLLNGANNRLHVANLRLNAANVDLNGDAGKTQFADAVQSMGTFSLMPTLTLPLPPTATPIPTVPPTATVEVTNEVTAEVTVQAAPTGTPTPAATATPKPSDTPAPTATPKPSDTPTSQTTPESTP